MLQRCPRLSLNNSTCIDIYALKTRAKGTIVRVKIDGLHSDWYKMQSGFYRLLVTFEDKTAGLGGLSVSHTSRNKIFIFRPCRLLNRCNLYEINTNTLSAASKFLRVVSVFVFADLFSVLTCLSRL